MKSIENLADLWLQENGSPFWKSIRVIKERLDSACKSMPLQAAFTFSKRSKWLQMLPRFLVVKWCSPASHEPVEPQGRPCLVLGSCLATEGGAGLDNEKRPRQWMEDSLSTSFLHQSSKIDFWLNLNVYQFFSFASILIASLNGWCTNVFLLELEGFEFNAAMIWWNPLC